MGLFDGKVKEEAAENEVLQKLSQVPLLDNLIEQIMNEEEETWIRMGQNYYDSCQRTVSVRPDSFEIKWSSIQEKVCTGSNGKQYTQQVEEVHGRVAYSYTKSGYRPLHSYPYGKKEVSTQRVCYLWASIIRERMAAKMPECTFGEVVDTVYNTPDYKLKDVSNMAAFTYTVPALSFEDWF